MKWSKKEVRYNKGVKIMNTKYNIGDKVILLEDNRLLNIVGVDWYKDTFQYEVHEDLEKITWYVFEDELKAI
jgi:hypothetical protein